MKRPTQASDKLGGFASFLFLLFSLSIISSCSDSRIFDADHDMANATWHIDSVQTFVIEIDDTTSTYDFFYKVRNAADYEFYNLYLKYTLEDSLHQKINGELQELILFDPKTGTPYGSGLGDIFSHEFPAAKSYTFPNRGTYYFRVQQYMRLENLEGIHSVGLRVDKLAEE